MPRNIVITPRTVREIPNSGGRQSHCFTSLAIVWSKELRQIEVEFASSLVGVHPLTFARVSEQNQEKRSLGGKQCKKSWRKLIDNNRFERQAFPIAAMFACLCYVGMYLSYDFTIFANFASKEHIFTCRATLRQFVCEVSVLEPS